MLFLIFIYKNITSTRLSKINYTQSNLPGGRVCCRTKKLRFTSCSFVKKPSWFFVKGFFVTRSYTKKDRSCTKKEFSVDRFVCFLGCPNAENRNMNPSKIRRASKNMKMNRSIYKMQDA